MTASTDRTSAVLGFREQIERTCALLASLTPIQEEDEDTLPGDEPDYSMTTTTQEKRR
jgi:hypothetical protein